MLIELLSAAGPELGRRWLASLMLVPPEQREAVVEAIEHRIAEEYGNEATP